MVRRGGLQAIVLSIVLAIVVATGACASSDVSTGNLDAPDPVDAAIDALETDACVPVAETCNGADDDCDEQIDEDFATLGDECMAGSGACVASGVLVCDEAGTGVECNAQPGNGGAETCNGINDDCDGATDEGFNLGMPCDGADADLCAEGAVVCAPGGATMCGDTTADTIETCNNTDDDCDTATDEGFGLGAPCDGTDSDACVEGTIVCAGDGSATCSDVSVGTAEICNGLDDDCMGGVDNGFAIGGSCSTGVGACAATGSYVCNGPGTGVVCNAAAGTPTAETCGDGIDQDCNGADAACPTNDLVTGAINITAGGVFNVDLTAAHNNHDHVVAGCGNAGGRDVFYTFSLSSPEVVYVDTFGSNFDTTVRIFNGACTALGANVTCFDDSCSNLLTQGAIQLNAGTYCLILDQYSSLQTLGNATLTFTRGGRPGTALPATSGTVTGTTVGGTNLNTGVTCNSTTSQGPDVGYYFLNCPATTRAVTASTCATNPSWDTILYLKQGSAGSTETTCNDDGVGTCGSVTPIRLSNLTGGSAASPGLFWLILDGYNGASSPYTLSYSIQ